jgi:hypothetical protein
MRDVDAETVLQAELEPGVLEWAGRPCTTTLASQQLPKLAFMAVWIGDIGYGILTAAGSERSALLVAIPVLMLAVGLFILRDVAASLVATWQTFYGVTDRRLLVLELGLRRRITSWTPQQITSLQRRDCGSGRGDVIFHQASADGSTLLSMRPKSELWKPAFVGLQLRDEVASTSRDPPASQPDTHVSEG